MMKAPAWIAGVCVVVVGVVGVRVACGAATAQPQTESRPAAKGIERIREDAEALRGQVKAEIARAFLAHAEYLPAVGPRTIYRDDARKTYINQREADALGEDARKALKPTVVDEDRYYSTKHGTPLAYSRAFEVLGNSGADPAVRSFAGKKVMDFGYGSVGQLRILASMGAEVVGVEVDTFLRALYSEPGDQGTIKGGGGGPDGSLTLVHGFFPKGEGVQEAVGGGLDLFMSKNTLKMGYIHPARPADPNRLVHLGVDDPTFLKILYDMLNPGGVVLIYNLAPALSKPDEEYIPWSDGRCPFSREDIEHAGFKIVVIDVVDDGAAREMGRALGWDKGGMDLENDLFAHYTVFQKPGK